MGEVVHLTRMRYAVKEAGRDCLVDAIQHDLIVQAGHRLDGRE